MTWLGAVPAWCWWLIALVLVAGGQEIRVGAEKSEAVAARGETATARTELADYRLLVAERDRRAAAQARTEEQRRQAVADEAGRKADEKYTDLEGRAVAAESRADGLRGEIARLRSGHRATCDTIATQQRQARTSAVVVLGGLLEESDRMAGSCAAALERSRIAGLACEAVVERIKGP
ncbi:DUF2514 family protein [Pseudomonas putida]|uniref:DUF2514 family protein n=1 Tax=Pseudomonas putida TaxID=303 RepID=UPI00211998A6|nr:DUF2514 family protein [Pseudomonas putida]